MLIDLYIENLMLIRKVQLNLTGPFTAITGESGSGKSSLMEALKIALGNKASSDLISHGMASGSVRASFDLTRLEPLTQKRLEHLFQEHSIPFSTDEPLIVTRTLFLSKPSKATLAGVAVAQSVLGLVGAELVEIIDAGASISLESTEAHLECLDGYGGLEELREEMRELFDSYGLLEKEKTNYLKLIEEQQLQQSILEFQIQEIEEACLKEDEESSLDEEISLFAGSEQQLQVLGELEKELESPGFIRLGKQLNQLERLFAKSQKAETLLENLQGTLVQAQECLLLARSLQNSIDSSPSLLEKLRARQDLLHQLKKKYGPTLVQVFSFLEKAKARLKSMQEAQLKVVTLEEKMDKVHLNMIEKADQLKAKRKVLAKDLCEKTTQVLHELNMAHAKFEVEVKDRALGSNGSDSVEFFLCPNPGEPILSVRKNASGGEMARVFLALKTLRAHKKLPPTLIFDEIDANIGGESATRLGKKLKKLSTSRQVICITHFAQVAQNAHQHLMMKKEIAEGKTQTSIFDLKSKNERQSELARMQGQSLDA